MNVRAGRPAFDWPYAGVHRSTSLTISSLLLHQCPACLIRLACIVFVIGSRWPYSWRRVGYDQIFILTFEARVMKEYSILPISPEPEPHRSFHSHILKKSCCFFFILYLSEVHAISI